MNFYSDKIINHIVDTEPLETIADSVDTFKLQCKYFLTKYSHRTINHGYTNWILSDPNIVIAFYCMDTEFDIENCPSMLVYRRIVVADGRMNEEQSSDCSRAVADGRSPNATEVRYYILFTCTKRKFRGQGYGTILLDNLQTRIREDNLASYPPAVGIPPNTPDTSASNNASVSFNLDRSRICKIILSSVEDAVLFYEAYGFHWTRQSIVDHPMLMWYEHYEEKKEYFVMELIVV